MRTIYLLLTLLTLPFVNTKAADVAGYFYTLPANQDVNINPDSQLKIVFANTPKLGNKGFVRIFDAETNKIVDSLDLSIPAGPTTISNERKQGGVYSPTPYPYLSTNFTNANTTPGTPSGLAMKDTATNYQLNIIGRFTDAFHFYPIIIRDNTATIYLHNNILEYGKTYYVTIDKGVITTVDGKFQGIKGKNSWRFQTKNNAPDTKQRTFIVSADGTGDFNTVQGCMDFIPDFSNERWTVNIKNGDYEELVYFRNKTNVSIIGESREGVTIHYANNEVFNPHPINLRTNELPGTFPSRRAAFAADNCKDMRFENLTIMTTLKGQAEGLLINGARNYVKNVHIIGSGDALQVNGQAYFEHCIISGDGDTVLGRGPAFFKDCTLLSTGPFMWIRNTANNHGNVFLNCMFIGNSERSILARSPINRGTSYPYAEAVLINCLMKDVPAKGWGEIGGDPKNVHFWEYNTRTFDGKPINKTQRYPLSRQLYRDIDAEIIRNYSSPEYVLGWKPE